jgi:hypothetical protein
MAVMVMIVGKHGIDLLADKKGGFAVGETFSRFGQRGTNLTYPL